MARRLLLLLRAGNGPLPPFTLDRAADYPARLDVDYPSELSRGLVLVKWWLLALPHYVVVAIFIGGWGWGPIEDNGRWFASWGLVGVLVVIAGVVLLFSGRYPRSIFDLVIGLDRWVARVAAYAFLMRDEYPPFRLDSGEHERAVAR